MRIRDRRPETGESESLVVLLVVVVVVKWHVAAVDYVLVVVGCNC